MTYVIDRIKTATQMRRVQIEASHKVSLLIAHHERLAKILARRKSPTGVQQWTYNAARLANLHKALALIKGTLGK